MSKEIETLLSLIDTIVNAEGTWKEKRDKIMDEASDNDKSNLAEFAGWFEE
jgi:hypothetical protein